MHCLVGLGNPGSMYDGTRHNIGFAVVDEVSRRWNAELTEGKGDYRIAHASYNGNEVLLVKPLTYMNNSGMAVAEVCDHYGLTLSDLLVICDDFQLPLGTLRLRARGSDGGHNGLYSIIDHVRSDAFPRLRCGIASPSTPSSKSLMADFVLELFTTHERPLASVMIKRAADACSLVITSGLAHAMNIYNTKPKAE